MNENKSISLKLNMLLNASKSLLAIIFPLITFPYVAKTLSVENLGKYNFSSSIISYFILLSALGISSYAIREGARIRNNKVELQKFASQIFTINIISTIISYVLFGLCLFYIPKVQAYKELLIIFSIQILFITIGVEWIFGIFENYLYITIRSLIFQFISMILLFLLVRNENDTAKYALVTVVASVGANVLNFFSAKKYIKIHVTGIIELKKHIKPILIIFGTAVACTIYVNSDMTILGFLGNDINVGLYSVSSKIYMIVKSVMTATIMVSVPRLSYYLGGKEQDKFNKVVQEIFDYLNLIIFPISLGLVFLSKDIILIVADKSYLDAQAAMIILSLTLPFSILAIFAGQCVLLPLKKETVILKATLVSASINIILNFILIPKYMQDAAAFTTFIAEMFAMIYQWKIVFKLIKISKKNFLSNILQSLIGCLGIVIVCIFGYSIQNMLIRVLISIIGSVFIYLFILLIMKNKTTVSFFKILKNR